jgi:uncharacterized protein (DUF2236 family)
LHKRDRTDNRGVIPSNLPPGSASWSVNREAALILGGGRALLLQLAHPGVAAGVAEHSDFRRRPLYRLGRTLDLTQRLTFGTPEDALQAAREINHTHQRVRGAGYQASDPSLLLWVQATLVDSVFVTYRQFVGPLSGDQAAAYYEETKRLTTLLGLPVAQWPRDLAAFDRYFNDMIEGSELRVDDRAKDLARAVVWPRVGPIPPPAWYPFAAVTSALMPDQLRREYGLPWRPVERGMFRMIQRSVARTVPHLPAWLRFVPNARRAAARWQRAGT